MNERWADIPEWIGFYQVSDCGRIKSLHRVTVYQRRTRWGDWHTHTKITLEHIMSLGLGTNGYLGVILHNRSVKDSMMVHRLVAKEFVDNSFNKPHVNHKDSNRENNHHSNLEWVTRSENMQHASKAGRLHGPGVRGSDHPRTNLTEEDVREIRELAGWKLSRSCIASRFEIGLSALDHILAGRCWKHVT